MDPYQGPVRSIPDIRERVLRCTPGKHSCRPGVAQLPENICCPGPDPVVRIFKAADKGKGCPPVLQPPECGYGPGPDPGVFVGKGTNKARDSPVVIQTAQCKDNVGTDAVMRIGKQPE